jgi:hypothetical protein
VKQIFLLFIALQFVHSTYAQNTFDITKPLYVSDNSDALQGLKQNNLFPLSQFIWQRPNFNNMNLDLFIGSMAINPSNVSQVFFSDNSPTNQLYFYNKVTGVETNTGKTFAGATQGSNGVTLPGITDENVFGINMMVINGTNNTGYAISRNKTLYTFGTASPYTITNQGLITDAPGNAVSFSNTVGGGVMINTDNRLTALVNIFQPIDFSYKYYFFDIDPATRVAKLISEIYVNFSGFQDHLSFISGVGITNESSTSMYASVYTTGESIIYNNFSGNSFNGVYSATNAQSIGDVSGVGKTSIKAVLVNTDFIWQGTTSTNWATASNWNKNAIPTNADNVIIPSGTTFAVTCSTAQAVKNITINNGALVTLTNTLSIAGNCKNDGNIIGTSAVNFNGTVAQLLSGVGTFKKLTVNSGTNITVATGSNLKIQ